MGMLWTSLPMVREDMVVFCVCWIADAATLYFRLVVLGSINKRAVEVRAFFYLAAADIIDFVCSELDGGSVPSREGKFPMSFWSLVSGLWSLGIALSGNQFLSSWWVFHPCQNWLL